MISETARRVGEEALHRRAAVRRERLAHRDERLRLVDLAAAEREREADRRAPRTMPEHGQPPARGDPLPDRAEVDLPLGVGIGTGRAYSRGRLYRGPVPTAPSGRPRATCSAPSRGRRGPAHVRLRALHVAGGGLGSLDVERAPGDLLERARSPRSSSPRRRRRRCRSRRARPRSIAAIVAATASPTYVKLRAALPSPKSWNAVAPRERLEHAR